MMFQCCQNRTKRLTSTRRNFSLLVLTTILFTLTLYGMSSHAQTYSHIYVDAVNGTNAPGNGTAAKPCKSITYALLLSTRSELPDPWHVHILPGVYDANPAKPVHEREIFPLKLRTEMIFEGTATAAECIIDGRIAGINESILLGIDTEGVIIRNLTIQNSLGTGIVLDDTTSTKETPSRLEGCVVHNNNDGLRSNMPLILTNNIFSGNNGTGFYIMGDSAADISENAFANNGRGFYVGTFTGDVTHNTFDSNSGDVGGFYVETFTGDITHNTFDSNSGDPGGGFYVETFTGDVTHNTFDSNSGDFGGGFYVGTFTGDVTHNTFDSNSGNSGGFYVVTFTGDITHNTFDSNSGGDGGFYVGTFTGDVTHNTFDSNSGDFGGGFHVKKSTNTVEVFNNIFFNNTAWGNTVWGRTWIGGSVYTRAAIHFTNNLFMISDNLQEDVVSHGAAVLANSPECRFHNNIFSGVEIAIRTREPLDLPITHNLFHDIKVDIVNSGGNGLRNDVAFWELLVDNASDNLEGDPLLVDPVTSRDFHLQASSPAIDAGTNEFAPTDDFDRAARPVGATVDIGPYEYGGTPAPSAEALTPTMLELVSGANQQGGPNTELANPFVVKVTNRNGSPLPGVTVTFAITAGGGALSTEGATTDVDGRASSTLTLGSEDGTNTVTVSVSEIEETVTFTATAFSGPPETSVMAITGTITNADGSPAGAGLEVTITIGDDTQTGVSEAGGVYTVTFVKLAGVVARSADTVEVQVVNQETGESGSQTVELSDEQILAQSATVDLQLSAAAPTPEPTKPMLSVPVGISLIHVPLKVTAVDGVAMPLESVGDLYDALGGPDTVSLLIAYNTQTQRWLSYLGPRNRGQAADRPLADDLGIIASMKAPVSIELDGDALGTNGSSAITLQPGLNVVGVPLQDPRLTTVSDLLFIEGIEGNTSAIIVSNNGEFKVVARAGDPGDTPLTAGQGFILTALQAATVPIAGTGWYTAPVTAAASPTVGHPSVLPLTGIQVDGATPVLAVSGSIVSPVDRASLPRPLGLGLRITVKNLSTGKVGTAVSTDDGVGYQLTFVDIETGRVAQIGDILEISAQSPHPLIGVQPLRYVVTPKDVQRGHIQLDALVLYEIPTETKLLRNYPNPFNPETWIPYRLAEDANVTLTIYDLNGGVVRSLNVGHRIAAVYERREKAIYWDGRTEFGERVASGIYFYHLTAGDYSATRKMVILK